MASIGTVIFLTVAGTMTALSIAGVAVAAGYYMNELMRLRRERERMTGELQTQNQQIVTLLAENESLRQRTARNNGTLNNANVEKLLDVIALLDSIEEDSALTTLRTKETKSRLGEMIKRTREVKNDKSITSARPH